MLDPAEPVTIGAMVGPEAFTEVKYLTHAKQMQALDADPRDRRPSSRQASAATRAACVRGYRTDDAETDRRRARLGARHDRGRRRRAARRRASRSAPSASSRFRPFPLEEVRAALGQRAAGRRAREGVRRRRRRHRLGRTCAWRSRASSCTATPWSPASAAGRSRRRSLQRAARATRVADRLEPLTFLDLDWELVERELERARRDAPARARTPRTSCATSASSPRGSH